MEKLNRTHTDKGSRRDFFKQASALAGLFSFGTCTASGTEENKPLIILRSGWQTVNIGDVAHTPGVLHLLQQYIPEAQVVLFPSDIDSAVERMLTQNFSNLKIVYGKTDADGNPATPELQDIFKRADLFLHGSGPGIFSINVMRAWVENFKKPFGIYGTTVSDVGDALKSLLAQADFVFCRETHSVANLKQAKVEEPTIGFAPDGTFAFHLLDDDRALPFLQENALEEKKFICAVPRLRYTPYHQFKKVNWSQKEIDRKMAVNEKYQEIDHAKMRDAIIAWVRETGLKVLVCPEMTYQLDIIHPLVIDPLPDDVKQNVVARKTFWLPDEAASVYKRAHAVISMECHSPIIAAAQRTPFFYLRQPEDTIKGQMYYDIGLSDWVFEIDDRSGTEIASALMNIYQDYDAATAKLAKAMKYVRELHENTMQVVRKSLAI